MTFAPSSREASQGRERADELKGCTEARRSVHSGAGPSLNVSVGSMTRTRGELALLAAAHRFETGGFIPSVKALLV